MTAVRILAGLVLVGLASPAAAQLTRQNNTTLRFPQNPQAAVQYELADALPGVTFDRPVAVRTAPGETHRIFVVERAGRVIAVDLATRQKTVFIDITSRVTASNWQNDRRTEGLSSIAFHPNFAANFRFFLSYNTLASTSQGNGHHNRVSEFRAARDRRSGDPNSEVPMITQYDEGDGHNINDLHFGPDGYLYIATGDEGDGGTGDDYLNAQKIDKDFFSAIMRIDVDRRAGNPAPNAHPASARNYSIPSDNPWLGATSFNYQAVDPSRVRTEFYAVGLRNPWRFAFDPANGRIFEGDVGQHGREEINQIVRGGNYGWSYREGSGRGVYGEPGGLNLINPIFEYGTGVGPNEGYSVTGGVVARGDAVPELNGYYIFSDYVSGNVWAMNVDAGGQAPVRLMGQAGIAGFGYDPRDGAVLAVNHDHGRIYRLQRSGNTGGTIPVNLADTGIFSNLLTLQPNPGIVPYSINVPFWSDGAGKARWFSAPNGQSFIFHPDGNWGFPSGSVFVKHFEIGGKRLETRVIVKNDSGAYGVAYQWNNLGTSATLVPDGGSTITYTVDGQARQWRIPSRSECMACHTPAGGYVLGFNTPQLNKTHTYGTATQQQLAALAGAGYLANPSANFNALRKLAPLNDTTTSRTYRVRSYLAANCVQCHQPAAPTLAGWDARITTPISQANIINGTLGNPTGNPFERVVIPGDPANSAILRRLQSTGTDRMPPIGSHVNDQQAINLLTEWINQDLPRYEGYDQWAGRAFSQSPSMDRNPSADADGDLVLNYSEFLLNSDPTRRSRLLSAWITEDSSQVRLSYVHPANRAVFIETNDAMNTQWRPLNNDANQVLYPAQTTTRVLFDPMLPYRRFFRLRVVEP